ncbi:MAG: pectate lyase [Haliscomenobacter sp.]
MLPKKNSLLLLFVCLLSGATSALHAQIPRDTPYTIYSTYIKLRKNYPFVVPIEPHLPPGVRALKSQPYKTAGGRELVADVFIPERPAQKAFPAVLLIHGGGWSSGSKENLVPMAQQLAKRGYVSVAVEYRLSPEIAFPAGVEDLKEALRWMRSQASQLAINPHQVAALGCSAGAQLASLLGTTGQHTLFDDHSAYTNQSAAVQAVVNVDGIVSFIHPEADAEGAAAARWLGGTRSEAYDNWKKASPLEYADAHTPPFLFINSAIPRFHAGRDSLRHVLDQYGIPSQVYTFPQSPHAFWLMHPWFDSTVAITTQFLDQLFQVQPPVDSIAERMLAYQRSCGGWPKSYFNEKGKEYRIDYQKTLTEGSLEDIKADSSKLDATYDNNATTREITYLIEAYHQTNNPAYLAAAEKGISYILAGQYANGGWPQFFPLKKGYYSQITFNDNLATNNLLILLNVAKKTNGFEAVDSSLVMPCTKALERGVQCILKTQIRADGQPTVWCAQHDTTSLQPANARSFELKSFSGMESVGIVRFLMRLDNPDPAIRQAIQGAVRWLEKNQIRDSAYVFVEAPTLPGGKDRVFIRQEGTSSWARFYDLQTGKPFFCGRDGVKKEQVSEIEHERRVGYAWYGDWAEDLLKKDYPKWVKKWGE